MSLPGSQTVCCARVARAQASQDRTLINVNPFCVPACLSGSQTVCHVRLARARKPHSHYYKWGPRYLRIFDYPILDWRMTDLRVLAPNMTYAGWSLKLGTHRLRALIYVRMYVRIYVREDWDPLWSDYRTLIPPSSPHIFKGKLGADGHRPEIPFGVTE